RGEHHDRADGEQFAPGQARPRGHRAAPGGAPADSPAATLSATGGGGANAFAVETATPLASPMPAMASRWAVAGPLTSVAAFSGSVGPAPKDGQSAASGQTPHAGLRAWQTRRPWKITRWDTMVHSAFGTSAPTACSTLTGSSSSVQPQRRTRRPKCVSTV